MELALSVSGPDQIHELASLEEWLLDDPELRACRSTGKHRSCGPVRWAGSPTS